MKKILAIAIVVVMTAALCLTASAIHNPDDTTQVWRNTEECALSFDTFYLNGVSHMDLGWGEDGGAHEKLSAHPVTVGDNETLTIRGWAGLKNGTVAEFGYKINEGTPVFDSSFTRDAEGPVKDAGGDYRMEIVVPIKGLTAPTLITAVIKGEGGEVVDFIEFSVNGNYEGGSSEQPAQPAEKSDDQWLGGSEPAGHSTGWWMNPISDGCDKYININFKAAGNFSGIHGYYLCNPADAEVGPTVVKAQILKDGTVLAEKEIPVDGDAWYDTDFGKTIPAGDYTLSFLPVSGNGGWFVLGSYDGQGDWTIDTNCATNGDTKTHPEIMLIGAAAASDPTPANPTTADASVIAIAAVACVALAGVVVAKKVR